MSIPTDPHPVRHLAVVTCMDCRIDVDGVLGLTLGDAHVIRNAGGRVTDDTLRSLAISCGLLGVTEVVVMQHTKCGLLSTDESLRERTGADVPFFAIADHEAAIREDIETLARTPFLSALTKIEGRLYDLDAGSAGEVHSWERPAS